MDSRILGRSNISVSPMGMGCWAIGGTWRFLDISGGWGEVDNDESIRTIHAALDLGINFFDTAATYGTGHSEYIVGKALANYRDRVVIATKFGFNVNQTAKHVTRYSKDAEILLNLRRDCETSLRQLNMDYIDLYQLHVWDYPIELADTLVDALETLVQEGKIRFYGWSTDSVESARAFANGEHCVAVQHDLNVVRDAKEMLALCEALNLASVNRSPLARGALTGKYDKNTVFAQNDVRRDAWSMNTFFVPTLAKLDALRDVLTSDGRTLTQGALAWIWARSNVTIPIPGIRTVAQATENAKAMSFGPLKPEQMRQIDELLAE